jgi:hypothetical protein
VLFVSKSTTALFLRAVLVSIPYTGFKSSKSFKTGTSSGRLSNLETDRASDLNWIVPLLKSISLPMLKSSYTFNFLRKTESTTSSRIPASVVKRVSTVEPAASATD